MNKKLVSVLALGSILVLGWVGTSAYIGLRAQQEIGALTNQWANAEPLRFSGLVHDRGMLTSSGSLILHYSDSVTDQQSAADLFQVQINYSIDHRVMLANVLTFDWTAMPTGDSAQLMVDVFDQNPRVSGQGNWGWDGLAQTHYFIPALKTEQAGDLLETAAVQGHLKVQQSTFGFELLMPSLVLINQNGPLRLDNIQVILEAQDRTTGDSRSRVSVQQIDFANGQAAALTLVAESTLSDDHLTVSIDQSIGRLTLEDTTVTDVNLNLTLEGLDAKSVSALSTIMTAASDLENLTAAQHRVATGAVRDLIGQGFVVGITNLSGTSENGVVRARAMLEVQPTPDTHARQAFDAAKQLTMLAEINLVGQAIAPPITTLGMMFGVLVANDAGFSGSLSLKQGELVVNGANMPFADELGQISALVTQVLQRP